MSSQRVSSHSGETLRELQHETRYGITSNYATLLNGISHGPLACCGWVCTREDTRENWDIAFSTKRKRCIAILNHATENSEANNRKRKTGYTLHT